MTPITATSLHLRLKVKGMVNGGLSTLSIPKCKELINRYKELQLDQAKLSEEAKRKLSSNRSLEGYKHRYHEKCNENKELEKNLNKNLATLIDIVIAVETQTPLKVENILSPSLITNLQKELLDSDEMRKLVKIRNKIV